MAQTIHCPHCKQALSVADDASGKPMRCPRCQKPFAVHFAAAAPAPPAVAAAPAPWGGRAVAAPPPASPGVARHCPTCQAEVPPGAQACLNCGARLPAAAPPRVNGPATPAPARTPAAPVMAPPPRPAPVTPMTRPAPAAAAPAPAPAAPMTRPAPAVAPSAAAADERPSGLRSPWLRLLPSALLALALVIILGRDFTVREPVDDDDDDEIAEVEIDKQPRLELVYVKNFLLFGLKTVPVKDKGEGPKKLTFINDDNGMPTNAAAIRIDDKPYMPGKWSMILATGTNKTGLTRTSDISIPFPGQLAEEAVKLPRDDSGQYEGWRSAWLWDRHHVRFTQTVQVIAGQPDPALDKRLLDTCLVRFTLKNEDVVPHKVGMRFLLDTFIGNNDGVPFYVPRKDSPLINTQADLKGEDVPDYVQALEHDQLDKPGTVAQVSLKVSKLEAPTRVSLTHYIEPRPKAMIKITNKTLQAMRNENIRDEVVSRLETLQDRVLPTADFWKEMGSLSFSRAELEKFQKVLYTHGTDDVQQDYDMPLADIRGNPLAKDPDGQKKDSAVVMYWEDKELEPGQSRELGFLYGLGHIASGEGGKLGITPPTNATAGEEFALVALVSDPVPGQTVELLPPRKLKLTSGDKKQEVPPASPGSPNSSVTWRVKADKGGTFKVTVRSSTGEKRTLSVVVAPRGRVWE